MNLDGLQTFLAVVETGSLSRAAGRLHVTQSTVSARLDRLDAEVGQPLLHRRHSGAELTPAGFKVQRYAELMVQLWRQARSEAALPTEVGSVCNLGCHPDLWPGMVDGVVATIERTGTTAFQAWPGEQADLDRWLRSGLVDAAVCLHRPPGGDHVHHDVGVVTLLLVSTRPRPLMRWDPDYVYVDHGEAFRRDHAAAYADGDTPMRTYGSSAWALDHLDAHGGSGYLPAHLVVDRLEAGALHVVPGAPTFERPASFVVSRRLAEAEPWIDDRVDDVRAALYRATERAGAVQAASA